jgi:hypothetical protein
MNESGYITVIARTAGGALPVENAVITVKDEKGSILYVTFTDKSGKTPPLAVPAPPKSNSSSPGAPEPPFYTYSIDTDAPKFISVRNTGVPVYPGITSIQTVELLPRAEGQKDTPVTFNESGAPSL